MSHIDNENFKADLHCHSYFSDGSNTPEELVALAKARSLGGFAIADHDNFFGFFRGHRAAQAVNMPFISAMELSVKEHHHSFHFLAYAFDVHNEKMNRFVQDALEKRLQRAKAIISKLQALGIDVSFDEILAQIPPNTDYSSLGRVHIAKALMQKGVVNTIPDAFNKYLKQNKPAFVAIETLSLEEAIDLVHDAGGVTVLAHPHIIKSKELLNYLLDKPFDGIEGYYCLMPKSENEKWLRIGEERCWLITGGSDYHGDNTPNYFLGSSWTNSDTFHKLYEIFKKNNTQLL